MHLHTGTASCYCYHCLSPEVAIPVLGAGRRHEAAQQGPGDLQLELPPLERRPLLLVAAAAIAGVPVLHRSSASLLPRRLAARSVRELLLAPGGLRALLAVKGESWTWMACLRRERAVQVHFIAGVLGHVAFEDETRVLLCLHQVLGSGNKNFTLF